MTSSPILAEHQLLTTITGPALGAEPPGSGVPGPTETVDRELLTALLAALDRFDATTFDPLTTLHVHLSEAALTSRSGVARVEGLGPAVLGELRDWLLDPIHPDELRHRITVRPVLDAEAVVPVDRYEWPAPTTELTTCRTPYEVFPFGTLPSRGADDDHARRYIVDGPPGQTSPENNAKLSRYHHRLKTNGNWILRHPEPGTYHWRTPPRPLVHRRPPRHPLARTRSGPARRSPG